MSERSRWSHINVPAAPEAAEGDDPDEGGGGAPGGPGKRANVSEPSGEDLPADTTTTGEVDVGGSVTGIVDGVNDEDWFKVVLEVGKTYQIDLKGGGGGGSPLGDPYLHNIRDSAGNAILDTGNDDVDADNDNYDSQIIFTPTTAGAYYLVEAGVSDTGTYTLSVRDVTPLDDLPAGITTTGTVEADGSVVRGDIYKPVFVEGTGPNDTDGYDFDTDWFAVDLKAGRTYGIDMKGAIPTNELTLRLPEIEAIYDADGVYLPNTSSRDATDDANSSHHLARVEFTPEDGGTYYIAATGEAFEWGDYDLTVIDITRDADEHPADRSTTVFAPRGTPVTGKIDFSGDVDWFQLNVIFVGTYTIDLEGQDNGLGSLRDPLLRGLYDADGNYISGTRNDDGGEGFNARITPYLEQGIYYIAVGAFGNHEGTYTLSVND